MIRDCSNKWSNIRIYVEHLSKYPKTIRPQGTIGTCLKGIEQRFPLVLQRGEQSLLLSERQNQVQYLDGVGQECKGWRLERAAGQQKHIQVCSVVNILSLDIQCCRHVTHKVLQERNYEGQTLLAIIEVNRWWRSLVTLTQRVSWHLLVRVNLAESLPIVLKKEYGCHRRDILKTEQCLARQLESSMSSGQIIGELNDLENSNSLSKRFIEWKLTLNY